MTKIGLVGASYQQRSLAFDAQRSINLYPVLDQQGKEVAALYGTPGLKLFATAGASPGRGAFTAANGRVFVVTGSQLYELASSGAVTFIGTLSTSSGLVSIDENGLQLAICDGIYIYIFTYATNSFARVTSVNLATAGTICFIDGYFIVSELGTGKFQISKLYDGTTWAALDFATAESSPDNLIRVYNAVGQLWLLGDKSIEIWTNTGASSFPFQRIAGAKLEVGILAPHTAVAMDNSIFWVGKDNIGSGIVYRAHGFTPQRISTESIELMLEKASNPSTLKAYSYQQDGHVFYVITGGGLPTTLVYDITTQFWHERAYLNSSGQFETQLGLCGIFAFGRQLALSRQNGKVYDVSLNYYDDDGAPLAAERVYTHISNEDERKRYSQLEISMETGVGLQSGTGSDPQITLWISKDLGRTWSNGYMTSFGAIGKYLTRAVFRRLGIVFNLTFKIRITDPVKRVLIGSYLK